MARIGRFLSQGWRKVVMQNIGLIKYRETGNVMIWLIKNYWLMDGQLFGFGEKILRIIRKSVLGLLRRQCLI